MYIMFMLRIPFKEHLIDYKYIPIEFRNPTLRADHTNRLELQHFFECITAEDSSHNTPQI